METTPLIISSLRQLLDQDISITHFKINFYGTADDFAVATELQATGLLFHQATLDEKEMDERLS